MSGRRFTNTYLEQLEYQNLKCIYKTNRKVCANNLLRINFIGYECVLIELSAQQMSCHLNQIKHNFELNFKHSFDFLTLMKKLISVKICICGLEGLQSSQRFYAEYGLWGGPSKPRASSIVLNTGSCLEPPDISESAILLSCQVGHLGLC